MRENIIKTIEKTECIKLACDCCGRQSSAPKHDRWQDGSGVMQYTSCALITHYDNESTTDEVDLCPDCILRIMELVRNGKLSPGASDARID